MDNTNFHSSLQSSPFEALYGYKPPHLYISSHLKEFSPEATSLVQQRRQICEVIKENLVEAQNRMKKFADRKRTERIFDVGDMVYLRLQPYRQNSMSLRRNLKLAPKCYGPFKILAKIGEVAYKLELPSFARIHLVFHVSLLKKHIKRKETHFTTLPNVPPDGTFEVSPLSILGKRTIKRGNTYIYQILVQWNHSTPQQATWEDYLFMARKFPSFLGVKKKLRREECHEHDSLQILEQKNNEVPHVHKREKSVMQVA